MFGIFFLITAIVGFYFNPPGTTSFIHSLSPSPSPRLSFSLSLRLPFTFLSSLLFLLCLRSLSPSTLSARPLFSLSLPLSFSFCLFIFCVLLQLFFLRVITPIACDIFPAPPAFPPDPTILPFARLDQYVNVRAASVRFSSSSYISFSSLPLLRLPRHLLVSTVAFSFTSSVLISLRLGVECCWFVWKLFGGSCLSSQYAYRLARR